MTVLKLTLYNSIRKYNTETDSDFVSVFYLFIYFALQMANESTGSSENPNELQVFFFKIVYRESIS